jgi:alpha-galactosidase
MTAWLRCPSGWNGRGSKLPDQLAGLNSWHINMQRVAVAGGVSRSRRDIHYAALLDPLAGSILSLEQIHDLAEEMLEAQRPYLPAGMWMPGT